MRKNNMTEKELINSMNSLCDSIDKLIEKIDQIITSCSENKPCKSVDDLSKNLEVATQKGYSDEEYIAALKYINNLKFKISNKQITWLLYWAAINHPRCGSEFEKFLIKEFDKSDDYHNDIIDIINILKTKYSNQENSEYLNGLINWIKDLDK